jgi:hypothetical protein
MPIRRLVTDDIWTTFVSSPFSQNTTTIKTSRVVSSLEDWCRYILGYSHSAGSSTIYKNNNNNSTHTTASSGMNQHHFYKAHSKNHHHGRTTTGLILSSCFKVYHYNERKNTLNNNSFNRKKHITILCTNCIIKYPISMNGFFHSLKRNHSLFTLLTLFHPFFLLTLFILFARFESKSLQRHIAF